MTLERANIAFERQEPVIYKGAEYVKITAIIKRHKNLRSLRDRMTPQSRYTYSCEILDKQGNSVVICAPEDLTEKYELDIESKAET